MVIHLVWDFPFCLELRRLSFRVDPQRWDLWHHTATVAYRAAVFFLSNHLSLRFRPAIIRPPVWTLTSLTLIPGTPQT
jgi:hypothetical protein